MNDKNDKLFRCSTFNGDTADGRTLWPDWLRDVELVLDEWSWAVMNGKTIQRSHPRAGRAAEPTGLTGTYDRFRHGRVRQPDGYRPNYASYVANVLALNTEDRGSSYL